MPAPSAVAQGIVMQQFTAQGSGHGAFVLTPVVVQPRQGSDDIPGSDLTADFQAFDAPGTASRRNAIALASAEPSTRQTRTDRMQATLSSECRVTPYRPSPNLSAVAQRRRATWYFAMVSAACEAGLPVNLFDALIIAESRYNPAALSPKGAGGLAQLMPDSARHLGVSNVWDPNANLRGGAHLLRALLDEFGRFDLALAAYNAGASRVRLTRQVPHIPETLHYVSGILTTMRNQLMRATDDMP